MLLLLVFIIPLGSRAEGSNNAPRGFGLLPLNEIHLEVAYQGEYRVTESEVLEQFPQAVGILSGNFFDTVTGNIINLLIIDGQVINLPSGKINRPVIAQRKEEFGGELFITTATRAWAQETRQELRIALEAGPFLIVNGEDWNEFDIHDPGFYRRTYRAVVGITQDDYFFWKVTSVPYRLQELRETMRKVLANHGKTIKIMMNLDGGNSLRSGAQLPSRLVIIRASQYRNQDESIRKEFLSTELHQMILEFQEVALLNNTIYSRKDPDTGLFIYKSFIFAQNNHN